MIVLDKNTSEPLDPQPSEVVFGDLVRIPFGKDGHMDITYSEPTVEEGEPESTLTLMETKVWLRVHFGSVAEKAIRDFALSGAAEANEVKVVLDMVRDRIAIDLELSDPLYAASMALLESASIITTDHATELIELGGHDVSNYLTN